MDPPTRPGHCYYLVSFEWDGDPGVCSAFWRQCSPQRRAVGVTTVIEWTDPGMAQNGYTDETGDADPHDIAEVADWDAGRYERRDEWLEVRARRGRPRAPRSLPTTAGLDEIEPGPRLAADLVPTWVSVSLLVAADRLTGAHIDMGESVQPAPDQHRVDRRWRHLEAGPDRDRGQPILPLQVHDLADPVRRRPVRHAVSAARTVTHRVGAHRGVPVGPPLSRSARTRRSGGPPWRPATRRRRSDAPARRRAREVRAALAWDTKTSRSSRGTSAAPLHDRRSSPVHDRYRVSSHPLDQPPWAVHLGTPARPLWLARSWAVAVARRPRRQPLRLTRAG
jgi:hypothetical protein